MDVSGTSSWDDPLFDFTSPGTITSDVFTEAAAASAEITTQQTTHPSTTEAQKSTTDFTTDEMTSGAALTEEKTTADDSLLLTSDLAVTTDNFMTTKGSFEDQATTEPVTTIPEVVTETMPDDESTQNGVKILTRKYLNSG